MAESLTEKLARLKAARNAQASPAAAPPTESKQGEPKQELTLAQKARALAQSSAKTVEVVEDKKVDILEAKRLVEDIGALELSPEAKGITGFNHAKFEDTLLELNEGIQSHFPEVATGLQFINRNLREHAELAVLLKPEQIAVVVRRVLQQRNIEIVPAKKPSAKKKVKVSDKAEALLASLNSDMFSSMGAGDL